MTCSCEGKSIEQSWGCLMFWGIVSLILGIAAIAAPYAATFAIEVLVGWLLIIGGAIHFFHSFYSKGAGAFIWKILISILYFAVGIMLLVHPVQGEITLTVLLAIFFLVQGFLQIIWAFQVRKVPNWGWIFFSGLLSLVLGGLIWAKLPSSAAWAIGLLLGINLIFTGWAIIMLSLALRKKC